MKEEKIIEGYYFCFNHQIQNIIKDAIRATPGMEKTLDVFKGYAATISRSKKERNELRKSCETADVPFVSPPVPGATRWFGELFLGEATLKSEDGIKLHCVKSGKNITPIDWKNIRGFVDILTPFHSASKIQAGVCYITISSAIPCAMVLHEKNIQLHSKQKSQWLWNWIRQKHSRFTLG